MKSITQFFKDDLKAPLVNSMWSWGAVDGAGRVYLRVWEKDWEHRERRSLVCEPDWKPESLGYKERMRQLALLEGGALGFLVVCNGHWDKAANKMVITRYRDDKVFPIGSVENVGEKIFARWTDPVEVASLRLASQT